MLEEIEVAGARLTPAQQCNPVTGWMALFARHGETLSLVAMNDLADLLRQTGHDHHQAFIETDGDDPEWPIWYAEYLEDKLAAHIGRQPTKSEIVYLLLAAVKAQEAERNSDPWPDYYAKFILGS